MSELLTPEHFHPHIDKIFRPRGGRHALRLTRIDMRPLQPWEAAWLPRQPFTLIFSSSRGDALPEGLYVFEVEGAPSFELYVMPIQTFAPDRQEYQAVFN